MMSHDARPKRTADMLNALRVMRGEMRAYDVLAERSAIRWVPPTMSEAEQVRLEKASAAKHGTRSCAHGVAFTEPCALCERSIEDTRPYLIAASQRIKELLAILATQESKLASKLVK